MAILTDPTEPLLAHVREKKKVAHMSRAKEMDLVKGSGLSPYEVDALHEVRKASSPTTISSKIKKMY